MKPCTPVEASVQQPSECSLFLLILVKGVNEITRTHTRERTHTPLHSCNVSVQMMVPY